MNMEKFNRFVAKHFWAVYVSLILALVALYFAMLFWDGMPGVLYLDLLVAVVIVAWLCVRSGTVLLHKAYKELEDHCDPEPYFKETSQQLSYPGNWIMKLTRIVNATTALLELGEYTQAYDMMVKIRSDIDRCMRADVQTVYYNNMAACCTALKEWPEAEIWYRKMLESFQKIKFEKIRAKYKNAINLHSVNAYYRNQDYMKAMQMLDSIQPQTLRLRVHLAAHYGNIYLALGETAKAREALTFVVENGNKLYVVQEARQMLAEMEESTST